MTIELAIDDRTSDRSTHAEPMRTRPGQAGPTVGVRPIPRSAPPALSWSMRAPVPAHERHPELPWLVETEPARATFGSEDPEGIRAEEIDADDTAGEDETAGARCRAVAELPDATAWSTWLAQLIVEVVHGRRPASQLARWSEEAVLATVVLRARQLRAPASGRPRRRIERTGGASLGSVRVQQPCAEAVEASAVIRGPRCSALAFRLEARGERWLCTAVDFGPQTPHPA